MKTTRITWEFRSSCFLNHLTLIKKPAAQSIFGFRQLFGGETLIESSRVDRKLGVFALLNVVVVKYELFLTKKKKKTTQIEALFQKATKI